MNQATEQGDSNTTPPPQKRKSGHKWIFVALLVFLGLTMFSQREAIVTIDCTPEVIASKPDIIMLGAWWCSYCYQAKRYFQKNNIHYCEYDMENTDIGKRLYLEHGGGAIPKLLIGNYQLSGFNERHIKQALDFLKKNPDPDN
jgi:glutaredoxin